MTSIQFPQVESSFAAVLYLAAAALSAATFVGSASLPALIAAFFVFEACVGMYFPSIGKFARKMICFLRKNIEVDNWIW